MDIAEDTSSSRSAPPRSASAPSGAVTRLLDNWYLVLAAILVALPGVLRLAQNYWTTEQGAAGPIILATGLWLLWQESQGMTRHRDRFATPIFYVGLICWGAFTILAAITVKQWLQLLGIYFIEVLLLYHVLGFRQITKLWAPLIYLIFIIPPPDNIVVPLTAVLKGFVSHASVWFLSMLGYPVAEAGGKLFIGQYELVVAAACSGLNSIVSLTAIGLFYVYLLHRATWQYAVILAVLMVPIAMFANAVRVLILLLVTYYLGEAAGQGILHDLAGILIFLVAMISLVLLDKILAPLLVPIWRKS